MSVFTGLFGRQKKSMYSGQMSLSFSMEESVFLLEQLLKKEDKIVVYDLNELNTIFEAKYRRAYTVAQYQVMSDVLMVLDGLSITKVHLIARCEYRNGRIGFEKGAHFGLCNCLVERRRAARGRQRTSVPRQPVNQFTGLPPPAATEHEPGQNPSSGEYDEFDELEASGRTEPTESGGVSKEDFRKRIQALRKGTTP